VTRTKTSQVLLLLLMLLFLHILVTSILCFLPFTTIVHKTRNKKKNKPFLNQCFCFCFCSCVRSSSSSSYKMGKKSPKKLSVKKRSFALLGNFNSLSVSRCVCVCVCVSLSLFTDFVILRFKTSSIKFINFGWFFLSHFLSLSLSLGKFFFPPDYNQRLLHVGGYKKKLATDTFVQHSKQN